MTQDERWNHMFQKIMAFMEQNKRRPSKHRLEEHQMHYWIKHQRRLITRGKLSEERVRQFACLQKTEEKFRRLNQYSYVQTTEEPGLFDNME